MTNPGKPAELLEKLGKPGHQTARPLAQVAEPVDAALWVSESDLPALAQLCRLHDQYADVKRRMELAEDDDTFLKYSLEARKLLEVQRGYFSDMGLNPVSRGKLGLTVATTKEITSKLDRWLK